MRVRNFRRFSFWANSTTEKSHLVLNSVAFGFADYTGRLAGAGLDVFTHEPLEAGNPLLSVREPDRLLLSPHNAWSPVEAIEILVECIARNIRDFYTPQNQ